MEENDSHSYWLLLASSPQQRLLVSLTFYPNHPELQNDRLKKLRLDYETELQMLTREFGQGKSGMIYSNNRHTS